MKWALTQYCVTFPCFDTVQSWCRACIIFSTVVVFDMNSTAASRNSTTSNCRLQLFAGDGANHNLQYDAILIPRACT